MTERKLLPCPFCGGNARLTGYSGRDVIFCDGMPDGEQCEAMMGGEEYRGDEEKLVRCWNRRVPGN